MAGTHLQSSRITETVEILSRRIRERFPEAGLNKVCGHLLEFAREAQKTSHDISRPMYGVRVISGLLVFLFAAVFAWCFAHVRMPQQQLMANEFVQVVEAGFNAILLTGLTLFFFGSLETRVKRGRALRALHELRSLAHVIDMHQLTKDPERVLSPGRETESSPKSTMTSFQLNRYLDYCSEMLALVGKIGALYVDEFTDTEAVEAVNDLESLTTGFSRKIWQKINILQLADERQWHDPSPVAKSAETVAESSEVPPPQPPATEA
ncbi:MAG: hypothetical protein KDA66_14870 [Planctomycetaceae bacterium]|nr:hypothetical protein [Planctomycetaceae bacterium]MCB9952807.1 hypothetical protein [Planctomycetaceae bacterium]